MANNILSSLGKRATQIALAFLAAQRGGPEAVAALQKGIADGRQAKQAATRQQMLDEERRQQQAAVEGRAQSAEARAVEDQQMQADAQRMSRINLGMSALDAYGQQQAETAPDAVAAENAMLGRSSALESVYGIPQGQLSGLIPNMTPAITRGVRADARTLLADAEAKAKARGVVYDDSSVTFTWSAASPRLQAHLRQAGHPEGQPFKPSQIESIAGSPTVTGALKPDVPNTSEEQFYQRYAIEHGARTFAELPTAEQAKARKQWMQADDRPQPQATVLIQTIDAQGNPVQQLVPRTPGTSFAPAPTASQQTAMAEQETGLVLIGDIERLFKPEYVGPVQGRATRLQMAVPGTPDVVPAVAEFHASVAGLRNEIIRLMSGAAVSGSEEQRMRSQLPDVTDKPSVFTAKLNQTRRNRETLLGRMQARSGGAAPAGSAETIANPFRR